MKTPKKQKLGKSMNIKEYPGKIGRLFLCKKKIIRDNPVYIFLDNPDYLVIFLDILQYFPGFFFNRKNPAAYRNNQKIIRDFLLIFA